jgi:hypothetical protein
MGFELSAEAHTLLFQAQSAIFLHFYLAISMQGARRCLVITQIGPAIAELCGDSPAGTRAGLIATQALCRYVLRLPPVVALERSASHSAETTIRASDRRYAKEPRGIYIRYKLFTASLTPTTESLAR